MDATAGYRSRSCPWLPVKADRKQEGKQVTNTTKLSRTLFTVIHYASKALLHVLQFIPRDRLLAVLNEVLVGLGEVAVPDESSMCTQWRRMNRLENAMPFAIDARTLLLRIIPPK